MVEIDNIIIEKIVKRYNVYVQKDKDIECSCEIRMGIQ